MDAAILNGVSALAESPHLLFEGEQAFEKKEVCFY